MVLQDLFLLKESGGFILQENGGKLIIGQIDVELGGGSRGGRSTAVGYSAVKKQQGLKPTEKFAGLVKGKVLSILDKVIPKNLTFSKLTTRESSIIHSKLTLKEIAKCTSKLILPTETCHTECIVRKHPSLVLADTVERFEDIIIKQKNENADALRKAQRQVSKLSDEQSRVRTEKYEDSQRVKRANEKQAKREKLLELHRILTEDIRKTPSIDVDLNESIHQRGDLMRITANMSDKSGAIYMRIIDNNGIIVQKAGQVKKNATGFQILVGTRDLKQGKYFVQVSNHRSFSPLGVAEFQVKGDAPILPFIPVIPFLLTPDSPTQKFEKMIFRTMMDSRVDEQCKQFENKTFNVTDKNMPVPPLHFNCRCWMEGILDE